MSIESEALRLHQRYMEEVVEAFNLCPWAKHARLAGTVKRPVILDQEIVAPTLSRLLELEPDQRTVVAIFLYPRLSIPLRGFDELAEKIRKADQDRHSGRPIFVAATFHPDYPLDQKNPSTLVPFLRRSPDPSIQFIRLAAVEEARGAHGKFHFDFSPAAWSELEKRKQGSMTDRVARDNHTTVARETPDRLQSIFQAIKDDRDRSYARFA